MADRTASPGVNTIQAQVNASSNGDRILLDDGLYTSSNSNFLDLRSATVGHTITSLTIQSRNNRGATLDFSGVVNSGILVGNSSGVKFYDQKWQGTPGNMVVDDSLGAPHAHEYYGIDCLAMTKSPWSLLQNLGLSMIFREITTSNAYSAPKVIDVTGSATNSDLMLADIDGRAHIDGTMVQCVRLTDVRDARIRTMYARMCSAQGLKIESTDNAKGAFDIDVIRALIYGTLVTVGIHVGNTDVLFPTKRVRLHKCEVYDSVVYGIEMENGVEDSEASFCKTLRTQNLGMVLAEDTKNCTYFHNVIDTVGDIGSGVTGGSGIAVVNAQRHRIIDNVIANCVNGIRHVNGNGFTTQNLRNEFRENKFYGIDYVYYLGSSSFPSDQTGHMFGPNAYAAPRIAYCRVDDVAKTQAQFAAQFPGSVDEPDVQLRNATELFAHRFGRTDRSGYTDESIDHIKAALKVAYRDKLTDNDMKQILKIG